MSGYVARIASVKVTPATTWLFLSLTDGQSTGWGEASLFGREPDVLRHFAELPETLTNDDLGRLPVDTLPRAALRSALMQARADLLARSAGKPLVEHLGTRARDAVAVYANINRRTRDRSPEGMAGSARDALAAGHVAIKIAPFDEVRPDMGRAEMTRATETGLSRVAAIRDAIGTGTLMVDCHWRFDPAGAERMIDACAPLALDWVECPIAETVDAIPALVALRARANARGMRLAGLETAILRAGFAPYLAAGAYDVMMPDVKYCGGPEEMLAIADDLARHGVVFSPHNPTGPVSHLHSLHVVATLSGAGPLETQFDETPLFAGLVDGTLPPTSAGRIALPAGGAGLGYDLVLPGAEAMA